ncbi:hypothetical protein INT43_003629 [Umbelopsis isabellina]|uniref:MAGE domain-containing protein n=1 Tax=Mortierella isabellina TaxID=91625 RepID=A0A8H7UHA8_MORIS|nr:hypothetical protein INT43_003629 [Umbelopsis isabellina]
MSTRTRRRQIQASERELDEEDYAESSTSTSQREAKRSRLPESTYDEIDSQMTLEQSSQDLERKVNDTVRYALACEHRKQIIRRDDIAKKVLGSSSRAFPVIFEKTQKKLRHLFGMELTELASKEKPTAAGAKKTQKAEHKAATSKAYILRNILPEEQNDPDIIHHTDEEHESTGLLYIILALLFVNEQTMDDETLTAHLDRLRVPNESESFGDRPKVLDGYVRQGYLARQKLALESNQSDRAVFQYSWGPRSKAEIPEQNMVGFISSVSN